MTPKIKICGLSRPVDIEWANEIRPDYIGFVFAAKSRRYVDYARAAELKRALTPEVLAVGVFVDSPLDEVAGALVNGIIDVAQLHGHEDAQFVEALRARTRAPIIQAFRVESREDVERARETRADWPLLDGSAGGAGLAFDWTLLGGMDRPFFLAGGLNAENVLRASKLARPFAVDLSSGVETDGVKDYKKMRHVAELVRALDI